jgi:hypothetical protein
LIKTSVADSDLGSGALLTPGYGMGKKSGSITGIRIKDEPAGSYFRKHRNHFFGLKSVFWIWVSFWAGLLDLVPLFRFMDPAQDPEADLDPYPSIIKQKNSMIRIRIWIHWSEAWIGGSGSTPICHGSGTLVKILQFFDADPGFGMEKIRLWDPGRKKI